MAHISNKQIQARRAALIQKQATLRIQLTLASLPERASLAGPLHERLAALQREREDLEFLLGLSPFCPPEWAMNFSAVHPPLARELPPAPGGEPEVRRGRQRRRPRPPASKLEAVLRELKQRRRLSWSELERNILAAYGLKSLGEVISVLKREYGLAQGPALLKRLRPLLDASSGRLPTGMLMEEWEAIVRIHEQPAPSPPPPSAPEEAWAGEPDDLPGFNAAAAPQARPQTPFEKRLLGLGSGRRWSHWREVGEHLRQVYAAADEESLAQSLLTEYGLAWGQIEHLRSILAHLSFQYPYCFKDSSDPRGWVKDWLYYFWMRLWVMDGRPEKPEADRSLPFPLEFNAAYPYRDSNGDTIGEDAWAPAPLQENKAPRPREAGRGGSSGAESTKIVSAGAFGAGDRQGDGLIFNKNTFSAREPDDAPRPRPQAAGQGALAAQRVAAARKPAPALPPADGQAAAADRKAPPRQPASKPGAQSPAPTSPSRPEAKQASSPETRLVEQYKEILSQLKSTAPGSSERRKLAEQLERIKKSLEQEKARQQQPAMLIPSPLDDPKYGAQANAAPGSHKESSAKKMKRWGKR